MTIGQEQSPDTLAWRMCRDEREFIRAAHEFCTAGDVRQLPVLKPPWQGAGAGHPPARLDRDVLLASTYRDATGAVLVTTPDPVCNAVAEILATATRRPVARSWRELDASRPVAHLGPFREFTADTLIAVPSGHYGVITAYTAADLTALVARMLLFPTAISGSPEPWLVDAVSERGREAADTATVTTGFVDHHRDLLAIIGHGRECSIHLPDGVVCARDNVSGVPARLLPGNPPTCSETDLCYLRGHPREKRVAASDLAASIVVLESCQSFALGTARFSGPTRLPLSFVHGNALAVVGHPGLSDEVSVAETLGTALQRGDSLGMAVLSANSVVDPTFTRGLMLLGDPEFRPWGQPSDAGHRDTCPADQDRQPVSRLREELARLLPALERFRDSESFCGISTFADDVDYLRRESSTEMHRRTDQADVRRTLQNAKAQIREKVEEFDDCLVATMVGETRESWYYPMSNWWSHAYPVARTTQTCLDCSAPNAERILLAHPLISRTRLAALSCVRCGLVQEKTEYAMDVRLLSSQQVARQTAFDLDLDVAVDSNHHSRVVVGAEVLCAAFYGARVATLQSSYVIGPGVSSLKHRIEVTRKLGEPPEDLLRIRVYVSSEGHLTCRTISVFVAPLDAAT